MYDQTDLTTTILLDIVAVFIGAPLIFIGSTFIFFVLMFTLDKALQKSIRFLRVTKEK
jgi:hypothetical protein